MSPGPRRPHQRCVGHLFRLVAAYVERPTYQSMGAVYWIFDQDARVVEAWLPDATLPTVRDAELSWQSDGVPEPLVIDLESFFRKVVRVG